MKYLKGLRPSGAMVVAIIALVVAATGTAVAAATIQSSDIVNGAVSSKKVKDKTLKSKDFSNQAKKQLAGPPGPEGPVGQTGPQGEPGESGVAVYSSPQWGQVDRNTIGSPTVALRGGPFVGANEAPPLGDGSLGLTVNGQPRTDTNLAEQATFGNESDFVGDPVSGITELGFSVYTTGENNAKGNPNMPAIKIEIDPNLTATGSNFSTLQFMPANTPSNEWTDIDATTAPASPSGTGFFLSGAAGTATGCLISDPCTFTEVQSALNDGGDGASILSIAVGKGRDYAFAGAVDALQVGGIVYDFEPFGVIETPAP